MNPQNKKQHCEPGRVARFADRWRKPAAGSSYGLGLCMSLAALVLGAGGSALAGDLTVSMMPSHHQNQHYAKAVVGQPIQVWGKVSGDDYAGYTIDFGDFTAPATGETVVDPNFINTEHTYTSTGTYVASLSVTNSLGQVFDRKVNIKVLAVPNEQDKIDIAVEKGLLNLYRHASVLPGNFRFVGTRDDGSDDIAAIGAAVLAFEKSGHLPENDAVADVYQNLVKLGLDKLKNQTQTPGYFQTRSFVLSTLALIQAMPSNPSSAEYSERWNGPEGQLIDSRINIVTNACNLNRAPYKGWTDDLSDSTNSSSNPEACEWVSYLLWIYRNSRNLPSNEFFDQVRSTWGEYFNIYEYPVSVVNGALFFYEKEGAISPWANDILNGWYSYWSVGHGSIPGNGWLGRIDNSFILANASRILPVTENNVFYQDWHKLIIGWLMGKSDLFAFNRWEKQPTMVGPNDRTPTKLFGQNSDGSWTGLALPAPNDVVTSPVATTSLAVSTLIRNDLLPSQAQIASDYGTDFVEASGMDNHPPTISSRIVVNPIDGNNPNHVIVSVRDSDNDLLGVMLDVDGNKYTTRLVNGIGEVDFFGRDVKPLFGTNTITATVRDGFASANRTWLIKRPDTNNPYFKNLHDIEIPTDRGQNTVAYYPLVYGYDLAGDGTEKIIVPSCNLSYGEKLGVGSHDVIFVATDAAGNSVTNSIVVTVKDFEPPTVVRPASITVNNIRGRNMGDVLFETPTVTDNCGSVSWAYNWGTNSYTSGGVGLARNFFPIGTNQVELVAQDQNGNTTSFPFDVVVVDNESPRISPIGSINVNCDAGRGYATVADALKPVVLAFDNSGADPAINVTGWPINNRFAIGRNQIAVTATDRAGNQANATYDVVVVDNQVPLILGSIMSITQSTSPGLPFASVSVPLPSATDNSGTNLTKKLVWNGVSFPVSGVGGSLKLPIGTNSVNYVVSDPSGNSATKSFTVTVQDREAPKFTQPIPNVAVAGGTLVNGVLGAYVNYPTVVVQDNDGKAPTVTYSIPTGSFFPKGSRLVTAVAMDGSGNIASVTFAVNVL